MSNLTNSEVVKHTLQALISKIGRRTSEGFAVITIDKILKELEAKYDFLKYIEVQNTIYSEGMGAVNILPDIDSVESSVFYKFINDLIRYAVRHLKRGADFFFIRELREAIDDIADLKLEQKGIDLRHMQVQYIVNRKQVLKIKNSEVIENLIRVLTCLLKKILPEKQAVKTVTNSVRKLERNYDFLKYIEMGDTPNSEGFYAIKVLPDINNVFSVKMAEAIEKLIGEVSTSIVWDAKESFIESLENELGEEQLSRIKKMGVNLSHIKTVLLQKGHEEVAGKALEALVTVVGRATSEGFAIVTADKVIKKLGNMHDVLKYIEIDRSRYSEGKAAISIKPEINSVKSYELGKALRDVIKITGTFLDNKSTASYIEEFKKQLGKEYLYEIEKIGVNLHFLELKFA